MYSDDETRRRLQQCSLKIMKAIRDVCEQNKLSYLLNAGSLLGAVRHKGFIPWDDDIDIWMPREDYEKFISIANQYLPKNYRVVYYTDFQHPEKPHMPFAQVVDVNTRLIRDWANKERDMHVWVDILPVDGMPKQRWRQELHYYHYRFLYIILKISWFDEIVNKKRTDRPIYERVLISFLDFTHLGRNWNTIRILDRIQKMLKKYPYETSNFVVSMQGLYKKKEIIPKKWIDEKILANFEDDQFYIPSQFDEVLTHYYGDYMTPPEKKEEREERHRIKIIELDE